MEEKKKKKSFSEILENILLSIKENIKQHQKVGYFIAILSAIITTLNLMGLFVIFPKIDLTKPDAIEFSQNENLKVLILPFHDSNDSNSKFKIEEVIENGLSEEKANYDLQIEIKIESLSLTPKNFNDALKIGNEKKADFVIFGDLDSESKEYRINFVLTKDFYEFDIPIFIKNKHISEFKKNLQLSKVRSLKDEKFIIYNILGFSELKNGHCEKGIKLLNKAIQLTNELTNLNFTSEDKSYYTYYSSECYFEKQEFENALPILDYSLQTYPHNYDSRIAKTLVHMLLGEFDKSKIEIDFLKTTNYYDKSSLYLASGIINLIKNKPELAYDEFDKSILLDAKNSIPSIAGGLVNILKGDFPEAIVSINKLTEYYEFEQPISNGVKSLIYFLDGNLQKTLNELSLLEKNIKNSGSDVDFLNFKKGLEHGYKLAAGDNYNKSEIDSTYNYISRKISKDADQNIEDAIKMLTLMKNKNDFRMISKHLKSAIKNNPQYSSNYNLNNLKQDTVIELKKIIVKNKKIIDLDSTNFKSYAKISNAYNKLGYNIISDYYQYKAIETNSNAILYLLPINKLDYKELFSIRESIKVEDSLIKIDNKNFLAYQRKGTLLKMLGFNQSAKKEIYKSLEINPNDSESIFQLGIISGQEENFELALDYYNSFISIDPNNYNGYFNRGAIFNKMSLYQEALKDINLAIKYYKGNDTIEINRLGRIKNMMIKKTTPNNMYN